MAGKKRNSSFEILTAMQDLNTPAGALQLAQILHLPSASIGRELLELEKAGLLVKVQNKGRILTPQGERFLEEERSRREKMKAANELIEAASMETESGLEDILLVRKLLEGYAAEACAERIDPKELQKLKDLQADYLYAIRHGRAGSEEDLAFHLKIAHLSGSPSILRMLKLILTRTLMRASTRQQSALTKSGKMNTKAFWQRLKPETGRWRAGRWSGIWSM